MAITAETDPLLAKKKADENNNMSVNYEIIQDHIGHMTWYLGILVAMACYVPMLNGLHQFLSVFLFEVPEYRCWVDEVDDNLPCSNVSFERVLQESAPKTKHGFNGCQRYTNRNYSCVFCDGMCHFNQTNAHLKNVEYCVSYVFNVPDQFTTATMEFDLVCERESLRATLSAVYFLGTVIGILAIGNLSDLIGRRNAVAATQVGVIAACLGSSSAQNVYLFGATRFMAGLLIVAGFAASFIYVVEITGAKWRTIFGIGIHGAFAFGCILLSFIAYMLQNWRHLLVTLGLLSVPALAFCALMPESPSWLFTKGKIIQGTAAATKIAKKNNIHLNVEIWDKARSERNEHARTYHPPTVLFRLPKMRVLSFKILVLWFISKMAFYAVTLNAGRFSGNIYLNNAIGGLLEIISVPIAIFGLQKFGRRTLMSAALAIAGGMFFASSLSKWLCRNSVLGFLENAFAQLGKLGVSVSFDILYVYTAEVYPTVIRGTAVGTASTFGSLATVVAPYALDLQSSIPWIIGTLCGVLSLLGAIICRYLPETRGITLMSTLEEAELFYD